MTHLKQILRYIISNSIKYSQSSIKINNNNKNNKIIKTKTTINNPKYIKC